MVKAEATREVEALKQEMQELRSERVGHSVRDIDGKRGDGTHFLGDILGKLSSKILVYSGRLTRKLTTIVFYGKTWENHSIARLIYQRVS